MPVITTEFHKGMAILAIEGCNGVGKSTLLNSYRMNHPDVECTLCVPEIFQTAKDTKHFMLFESSALCSALYYLGGAVETFNAHNPEYTKIILDRSIWSTFAAAYVKDEQILPILFNCLSSIKSYVLIPDHIVVLEASYQTCKKRSAQKIMGGEFDRDGEKQHEKKAQFYHLLSDAGYSVTFIDVNYKSPNEVYAEFEHIVLNIYGDRLKI